MQLTLNIRFVQGALFDGVDSKWEQRRMEAF
jgi:hypothetical protein